MTCEQIAIEYKANTEVAANRISKNRLDDTHDIIVGFLAWPGLADFRNADGNEGNALLDRNICLLRLPRLSRVAVWSSDPFNRGGTRWMAIDSRLTTSGVKGRPSERIEHRAQSL